MRSGEGGEGEIEEGRKKKTEVMGSRGGVDTFFYTLGW